MQADWTNITDPVFHWAAERPDQVAFYEGHQCLTYGELAPLVAKAAVHLGERGIRAGDRVALSLTNSIDHFILLLGLLRLGATPMEIPYEVPPLRRSCRQNSRSAASSSSRLCRRPRGSA